MTIYEIIFIRLDHRNIIMLRSYDIMRTENDHVLHSYLIRKFEKFQRRLNILFLYFTFKRNRRTVKKYWFALFCEPIVVLARNWNAGIREL